MTQDFAYLLSLISTVIEGAPPKPMPDGLTPDRLRALARQHHVSALAYHALPQGKAKSLLDMDWVGAKYADAIQHFAYLELAEAMESGGIDHCFIKGVDVKSLYPISCLRETNDIDLLIRPRHWDRSCQLMAKLGYTPDVHIELHSTFQRGDVVVELHRMLLPEQSPHIGYEKALRKGLCRQEGTQHGYQLTRPDQYLYTILHAEKHIVSSEFIVKFLVDIRLYRRLPDYASWRGALDAPLKKLGLTQFAKHLEGLADGWLAGAPMDADTQRAGEQLLAWGPDMSTSENLYKREWGWIRRNMTARALLRRLFPSYAMLFACRPELGSKPWLTPLVYLWYLARPICKLYPRHRSVLKSVEKDVSESFRRSLPQGLETLYGKSAGI